MGRRAIGILVCRKQYFPTVRVNPTEADGRPFCASARLAPPPSPSSVTVRMQHELPYLIHPGRRRRSCLFSHTTRRLAIVAGVAWSLCLSLPACLLAQFPTVATLTSFTSLTSAAMVDSATEHWRGGRGTPGPIGSQKSYFFPWPVDFHLLGAARVAA